MLAIRQKQAGAELYQAQEKLGLANKLFLSSLLNKLRFSLIFQKLGSSATYLKM
jgi:hypothetical protein